jgi:hypothetical protein
MASGWGRPGKGGFNGCPSPLQGDRLRFLGCASGRLTEFVPISENEPAPSARLCCPAASAQRPDRVRLRLDRLDRAMPGARQGRVWQPDAPFPWVLRHVDRGDLLMVLVINHLRPASRLQSLICGITAGCPRSRSTGTRIRNFPRHNRQVARVRHVIFRRDGRPEVSGAPGCPGTSGQRAAEISQAALESLGEVGDRRVAARRRCRA